MPEPPVAAPDHAAPSDRLRVLLQDAQALDNAIIGVTPELAVALLVERQQDKERIERLETALFEIATCLDVDVAQVIASRVLAGEKDAK